VSMRFMKQCPTLAAVLSRLPQLLKLAVESGVGLSAARSPVGCSSVVIVATIASVLC
jgi:hypothetical protein